MAKYLNLDGLQTLWAKLKDTFALKKHSHTVEDIPVDTALSSTSENPVQNKVVNAALDGKVPTSRTINGKSLSANISLSASDVGATPFKSVTYDFDVSTDTEEWIRIGSIYSGICSFSALMMLGSGPGNCFVDITASCMAGGWGSQKLRVNACSYVNDVALIKKVRLVVKGNATGYLEILKGKYSSALKKTITIQLDSNATGVSLYSTPQTAGVPDGYSTLEKDSISDVWLKNLKDSVNIVNNLTSTSTNDALSAAQGKNLKDTKADAASVTGATKCKVTYNSQGVITAGADLAASDIPNLAASKITSGTFTDERIASASKWNAKQDDISDIIPTAASASNPLCDKAYADAIGERLEARYLGCNANGDPFATHAALTSATKFYYQGAETTPDTNDITTVVADEDHKNTSNVAGTTRYRYGGVDASGKPVWAFEYVINNTGLSEAQLLAVNSGITATKVGNYDSHIADTTKHITAAERTAWNGKQNVLTQGTNITISGNTISATDTTYANVTPEVIVEILNAMQVSD